MKKILCLIIATMLSFSLVACGGSDTQTSTKDETSATGNTLAENNKKEEEYTLLDEYNPARYTIEFIDDTTVELSGLVQGNEAMCVVHPGTYTRDKNLINCDIDGHKVVFRLFEDGIVNLTDDACAVDALADYENPAIWLDLRNVDFSSLESPSILWCEGHGYLYFNGWVFKQYDLDYYNGERINKVNVPAEHIETDGLTRGGMFDCDYLVTGTHRYLSYGTYEYLYRDTIAYYEKLAKYIAKARSTNILADLTYYTVYDAYAGPYGPHYDSLLQILGGLYWTVGDFDKAKEAFASMYKRDEYIRRNYPTGAVVNEYNMLMSYDNSNTINILDENGLLIEYTDNNKTTYYRYDELGRLIYEWDTTRTAYKYVYNLDDNTISKYTYMEDRYGTPLYDESVFKIESGTARQQTTISSAERRSDYVPDWLAELGM